MTGRPRGRPPKAQPPIEPQASPVRRTTRQHNLNQQPQEQAMQAIDPSLTDGQDGGMMPPPVPEPKIARRGTRREPREDSVATSLHSVQSNNSEMFSSQAQSYPSNLVNPQPPGPTARLESGTPARGASVSLSELNGTPGRRKPTPQLLARILPRLSNTARDFFAHLSTLPQDRSALTEEQIETWELEREITKTALEGCRKFFVDTPDSLVIAPRLVLGLMGLDPRSPQAFRASRTILATNFATLLDDILLVQDHSDKLPTLQDWDREFPRSFFVDEIPPNQISEIVFQVTEIRTQVLIFTLESLGLQGPAAIEQVSNVFFTKQVALEELQRLTQPDEGSGPGDAIRPIQGIDIEATPILKDSYITRVRGIIMCLNEGRKLQEDYKLHSSLGGLRGFAERSFRELYDQNRQESSPQDLESSRHLESQIQSQLQSEVLGQPFSAQETRNSMDAAYSSGFEVMRQPTQDLFSKQREGMPGVYTTNPVSYPPGFDPQHVAPYPGAIYAESAAQVSGVKRPAPEGQEAPQPPPKKTRKRRRNPYTAAQLPDTGPPVEGTPRPIIPAPDPQHPLSPSAETDFAALSQKSRELSAASRKGREPQVRSPWVQPDIRLLVSAVDTYKCKWSLIEKAIKNGIIPFKLPRDQQALRDKARLLKQDFLKADGVLPKSFDLVVLGKKERAAVIACGKNPDRKEEDVDENGKPTNTEYGAEVNPGSEVEAAQM